MSALPKRVARFAAAGLSLGYVIAYLATTVVTPQGTGGLTGPLKVRMFRSEAHLALIYPAYLVERWARNGSLIDASYHFNVDFTDGKYKWRWLYGDGKYSRIWYNGF